MTAPTLVLDLDGTLAETHLDLIPTLNRTTATVGLPPIAMSDVGYIVGKGIRPMIQRAFELHGSVLEDTVLDQLNALYLEDYSRNLCVDTVLYPNVEATLQAFLSQGWKLAICTNKLERLAKQLVRQLRVDEHFVAITGADTFAFRKPDPRHLTETIGMAGGSNSLAVMVGDSITDIQTAKNAGIPVIGVTFGYSDCPIEELQPDAVVSDYAHMFDVAQTLIRR